MANIYIYGGLGLLCLGAVFGLSVAIKGYVQAESYEAEKPASDKFSQDSLSPLFKKIFKTWAFIMASAFVVLAIGMSA